MEHIKSVGDIIIQEREAIWQARRLCPRWSDAEFQAART